MKLITVYVPEGDIRDLDLLVKQNFYANRAQAIRTSIRDLLKEHRCFNENFKLPPPSAEVEAKIHSRKSILVKRGSQVIVKKGVET